MFFESRHLPNHEQGLSLEANELLFLFIHLLIGVSEEQLANLRRLKSLDDSHLMGELFRIKEIANRQALDSIYRNNDLLSFELATDETRIIVQTSSSAARKAEINHEYIDNLHYELAWAFPVNLDGHLLCRVPEEPFDPSLNLANMTHIFLNAVGIETLAARYESTQRVVIIASPDQYETLYVVDPSKRFLPVENVTSLTKDAGFQQFIELLKAGEDLASVVLSAANPHARIQDYPGLRYTEGPIKFFQGEIGLMDTYLAGLIDKFKQRKVSPEIIHKVREQLSFEIKDGS